MNGLKGLLPNAWYVAMREYRGRVSSRSFVIGTILLAAIAFAAAEAPVIVDALISGSQTKLAVVVEPAAQDMPSDARALFEHTLNGDTTADSTSTPPFAVTWYAAADAEKAAQELKDGKVDAELTIGRTATASSGSTPDLTFTLKTDMVADGHAVVAIKGAAQTLVVEDRLAPKGSSLAQVLAAYDFSVVPASPGSSGARSTSSEISSSLLSTGLIVMIFMAIITYGTWVAMSVAEEKGSRVMELMLNAATPLQMLAGKVVGNGAAGLTQYGVVLAAGVGGVLAQGRVRALISGGGGGSIGIGGLTPSVLVGFAILFVLGFAFYSLLYAALGSLVSRQEDVQSATSPLMVLIMAGYFMSIIALNTINEPWVKVASYVPFFSPYLMLARISAGDVAMWEVGLAAVILIASIGVALALAARIYSAGVLLYGQRVGIREVLKAARVER
jgi:ABC-2 type transport system permease protein